MLFVACQQIWSLEKYEKYFLDTRYQKSYPTYFWF